MNGTKKSPGRHYSEEPADPRRFAQQFNKFYSTFAPIYAWLIDAVPLWRGWIEQALPFLHGPLVLEVACGTGHLMAAYAGELNAYGIDLNPAMAQQTISRLNSRQATARIQIANVGQLPYRSEVFNNVVATMAFSGFPDGRQALSEMRRVLRTGGSLVLVDINFPSDGNRPGTLLTKFWQTTGDLIRDIPALFQDMGWACTDEEVGGFGSVHLYTATKKTRR